MLVDPRESGVRAEGPDIVYLSSTAIYPSIGGVLAYRLVAGGPLLREEQLNLKAQGPRAPLVSLHDIVERLNVGIHCLPANVEDPPAAATYRYGPFITRGSFPVRGDDGGAGQVPAVRDVVVHKRLHQELVNVFSIFLTANRRYIGHENTYQPWALNGQKRGRESRAVLAGAQAAIGCS